MALATKQNSVEVDQIDRRLLHELQEDADRPNVELARLCGLSPAATLNRVRRLKEAGLVTGIKARLDATVAGFPLQVYVAVTLAQHDERSHVRFEKAVQLIPGVLDADWVTGETDAMLTVVARDVDDLQRILNMLQKGGAQRIITLLRLERLKRDSPLPV
ncbi:MAG: Lrp/AsnC family transcriptional regulator [Thermoleophilaceae bacterium]|nr:Lrp/AsnC family transcriptional regulator [Thermoleophilaceae bacterium]